MSNKEVYAVRVEELKTLERIKTEEGIIIGKGDKRIYYNKESGKVYKVENRENKWYIVKLLKDYESKKYYVWVKVPGIDGLVAAHVLAAVALGMFDGISGIDAEVNHMDFCKINNKPSNLEVVSHQLNINHSYLRRIMRKEGLWVEGTVITAGKATEILELYKHDVHEIALRYSQLI